MNAQTATSPFAGLDLLATAVMVIDDALAIRYVNTAAESLFAHGGRTMVSHRLPEIFSNVEAFEERLREALKEERGFWDQNLALSRPTHDALHVNCLVTPVELPDAAGAGLVLELRAIEQRVRAEREEQQLTQHLANRELIRNLAHEVRNPLGGLRGSAQLLEGELADRPDLREYTQVIIKEADRLQALMDRLLTPHRPPHAVAMNVHEVCERVRSLILAEYPRGLSIRRDYDISIPEFRGDREQLIQAVLNVARNGAQALLGASPPVPAAELCLRTRVIRQVTLSRRRYRLALELQVIDNGPGIPSAIRDTLFFPLVSGREGGSGLGLTLAQTFIQYHHGVIECDSQPGRTVFRIILPIEPLHSVTAPTSTPAGP